jgi:phospholipase/carboxylesterase
MTTVGNPHLGTETVVSGATLETARRAAVVVHGRAQTPAYMLENLVVQLGLDDVSYVLPAAAGESWYPGRFFESRALNEPWLDHALAALDGALALVRRAGLRAEQIVLAGFSQGGCLVCEHVARWPDRYAGVAVLTGGLIGATAETWAAPAGTEPLAGLPVYFGTREGDDWVPTDRVRSSAAAFAEAGAEARLDVRGPGPHAIDPEDVLVVRSLLAP